MIKKQYNRKILKTVLSASVVFFSQEARGVNIDPFSFCTNSCKKPGLCETDHKVKSQCEKMCGEEGMWKQVASLQMSNRTDEIGKKFRKETNKEFKDALLYGSPIAKCLDKVDPRLQKPDEKFELKAKGPAAVVPSGSQSMCSAALKAEIEALKKDEMMLEKQRKDLEEALSTAKK